ncbi:MAG: lysophospholipase L1-like esterase [Actinomycetes bacterium]|jgi:acyl-CoA thioesterase-1
MKGILIGSAASAAGVTLAGAGAAAYVNRMVQGRVTGDIEGFIDRADPDPGDVVVLIGDSLIRGRAGVDVVELLRGTQPSMSWVNGGVQGDTSFDLSERLVPVLGCHPNKVIIMIGTNDVRTTLDPTSGETRRKIKELPETPTVELFGVYLEQTVSELQRNTAAVVALCSLPPLGQDLTSATNERIREFNETIAAVARATGATYLPVYERFSDVLVARGVAATHPYSANWRIAARSLTTHYLVGRSFDQIAKRDGLQLSPDTVHFNTEAAEIVAGLIDTFVTEN